MKKQNLLLKIEQCTNEKNTTINSKSLNDRFVEYLQKTIKK